MTLLKNYCKNQSPTVVLSLSTDFQTAPENLEITP